jgi:transglutaminase-like putative cysteine protease
LSKIAADWYIVSTGSGGEPVSGRRHVGLDCPYGTDVPSAAKLTKLTATYYLAQRLLRAARRSNMRRIALCVILLAALSPSIRASEPSVDTIDYATPQKYLDFPDSLGDRAAIQKQADELKGKTDLDTIRNVLTWMNHTLKYDGNIAYRWRNYDDAIREKKTGGCADEGIVCGVLLKAAGIPTVWVKTMDVAWIWDFKKGRAFQSWSGHVFLEVFVNGKWALLDPGGQMLYQDYSPQTRILPGRRFAYHKGNDPKTMIMSLQWEEWKQQTRAYFTKLDESLLPVDERGATSLFREVYVIGNSPYYQKMTQMAREAGLRVAMSFNTDYDRFLPKARGHLLLIETHRGKPIVSAQVLEKYFPNAFAGLSRPKRTIQIGDTTVRFIDFAEPPQSLGKE